jgi:hypothetical protein
MLVSSGFGMKANLNFPPPIASYKNKQKIIKNFKAMTRAIKAQFPR